MTKKSLSCSCAVHADGAEEEEEEEEEEEREGGGEFSS